jgi:hypothetical protein
VFTGFGGKPDGKVLPGRPRPGWEDNITIGLQEAEWGPWTRFIWLRIGTGGGNFLMR